MAKIAWTHVNIILVLSPVVDSPEPFVWWPKIVNDTDNEIWYVMRSVHESYSFIIQLNNLSLVF